jgi:hypothetical protein
MRMTDVLQFVVGFGGIMVGLGIFFAMAMWAMNKWE